MMMYVYIKLLFKAYLKAVFLNVKIHVMVFEKNFLYTFVSKIKQSELYIETEFLSCTKM